MFRSFGLKMYVSKINHYNYGKTRKNLQTLRHLCCCQNKNKQLVKYQSGLSLLLSKVVNNTWNFYLISFRLRKKSDKNFWDVTGLYVLILETRQNIINLWSELSTVGCSTSFINTAKWRNVQCKIFKWFICDILSLW